MVIAVDSPTRSGVQQTGVFVQGPRGQPIGFAEALKNPSQQYLMHKKSVKGFWITRK